MPELPEVETVVRTLRPRVEGRRIDSAEVFAPRIVRHCLRDPGELSGKRIERVERRGKFILLHLDHGALVIHLGMTGKLSFDTPVTAHTRAVFHLDNATLVYDDARMFGSIEWDTCIPERVTRLGGEPLAIDAATFYALVHPRTAPIKALLLNQHIVRGMGNIYTDEALFRAGIHPATRANRLSRARVQRLVKEMKDVLREAISHRGSSIISYRDSEGRAGSFQSRHLVYGREGEPCSKCGAKIRRTVIAGRGTHYCSTCQKR
jgi:formamidopyrimidine-DNA glycosylase